MAGTDYYDILGISKDANEKEIKSAFRKKASVLHPDKNKDPKAPEEFKKVNEAYQILSDPEKRKMYDQYGSAAFNGGGQGAYGGQGGMEFDFSEFFGGGFESMFGGGESPFGDLFGGRQRNAGPAKGSDIQVQIKVTLEDIILGPEREISYNRKDSCSTCKGQGGSKVETCATCKGQGRVAQITRSILGNMQVVRECPDCHGTGKKILEKCSVCKGESLVDATRVLKIRIPKGIEHGMNLRFKAEGNAGKYNTGNGDLFVEIALQKDKLFNRKGDDLTVDINLPLYSLVLGDEVEVESFDGVKRVKIPAGMQIGEKLSLKELGIPNMRTHHRGNIIMNINVDIPKSLSKAERELFEKLKEIDGSKSKKFWKK